MEPFTPIIELAEVQLDSVNNTSRTDGPAVTSARHLAYQASGELGDFPTDDEGIVRLRDVKIKSPVPLRLASITSHQREANSSHSVNRGPFSLPTHAGSVWAQVEAALEEEGEEFLEKVHKPLKEIALEPSMSTRKKIGG